MGILKEFDGINGIILLDRKLKKSKSTEGLYTRMPNPTSEQVTK
jgi:hypothetical protein